MTYAFTNRTPHMQLSREAFQWLEGQIQSNHLLHFMESLAELYVGLGNIALSPAEQEYLRRTCPYFSTSYLEWLSDFRLKPSQHVKLAFDFHNDSGSPSDKGDLKISVEGRWVDTILYEIPLLALTSEAYFRFCDKDWNHDGQLEKAKNKGLELLKNGCIFSEFGTRRRRDYKTMTLVIQGLIDAANEGRTQGLPGKLSGTSNVHFAMQYRIPPVGTVAHEWFMGIASLNGDYRHANETALRYWVGTFGEGVLGIALTDTFGTPAFLNAFRQTMPTLEEARTDRVSTAIPAASHKPNGSVSEPNGPVQEGNSGPGLDKETSSSYAHIFTGVRQDSGDPIEFVKLMRRFYDEEGIKEKKTIVFSDSLNVEKCIIYKEATERAGLQPTFGIGTFFTSMFRAARPLVWG